MPQHPSPPGLAVTQLEEAGLGHQPATHLPCRSCGGTSMPAPKAGLGPAAVAPPGPEREALAGAGCERPALLPVTWP